MKRHAEKALLPSASHSFRDVEKRSLESFSLFYNANSAGLLDDEQTRITCGRCEKYRTPKTRADLLELKRGRRRALFDSG
jgi:hypothetical protein